MEKLHKPQKRLARFFFPLSCSLPHSNDISAEREKSTRSGVAVPVFCMLEDCVYVRVSWLSERGERVCVINMLGDDVSMH